MDIFELGKRNGKDWDEILKAQKLTLKNIDEIKSQLSASGLSSTDVDVVVFGSIARDECTIGSDVDWTLLVDGQASSIHLDSAHIVENAIVATNLSKPGATGMFGQITFSHDLIHYIGGQDDTNHNLSRRILLILESRKLLLNGSKPSDLTAYDRVVRGIIQQYVDNDSGFSASKKENVPRFLLNDFIRFWRTMCVDFAFKQREQQGKKWALRNIKLRMARRLIFIKGLLMCFLSYKKDVDTVTIKTNLINKVSLTPLEFMLETFINEGISDKNIIEVLESYNDYLRILNDKDQRDYLSNLKMEKAYGDSIFEAARENSHKFQDALNRVFIYEKSSIQEFTLKYGIF